MPYSRPLLATDLSDAARPAARLLPLLSSVDAKGRAVMVLPFPDLPAGVPRETREDLRASFEERRHEAEGVLREWLHSEKLSGFEAQVLYGAVVRTIAHEAATADIVALGSTGMSRLDRVLLGSVARGVLRRVGCDTLIARGDGGPVRNVLVATDFQLSSRAAIEAASTVASQTGANVHLLHVIDPGVAGGMLFASPSSVGFDTANVQKFAVDELHRINAERFDRRADERIVHGRAAAQIVAAARSAEADLVVVGSHGEGIASRILLGSVAEAVTERAPCTVLVVRPRRASATNGAHAASLLAAANPKVTR